MSSRILAGRYELLDKIGDGGMAVVYKAKDRLLTRNVAIKILKPQFAKDAKFIENFRRESQNAASLAHPNIVNIYDVGREGNIHYIVMELVEGSILSDEIKEQGAIPWNRALEITKEMCMALSLAHKNQVIHRDVKPHNILLTKSGTAKLTDFGIAKALDPSQSEEQTGTIMGSVHYFSPEQARGAFVDEKSDIYSLGIVLYEMLTGQVPFDGENPIQVALMHINNEMTPPRQINPSIPKSVEDVVMKATDKVSINRYASADEMLKALEEAEFIEMLGGKPVADEEDPEALALAGAGEAAAAEEADKEGEKEEGEEGKKLSDGKIKALAIILAFIIALPLSFGIIKAGLTLFSGNGSFECPQFTGMTWEAALEEADKYGITLEQGDTVFSEFEAGLISSQSPGEGAKMKPGNIVKVNISKGIQQGTVPKIEGMTFDSAVHILEKYGFKQGTVSVAPSSIPKDVVISQSPAAGSEYSGLYVDFVVSSGTAEGNVIMPLLTGKTLEEATKALEDVKLKVGEVTYEETESYPEGQVSWQQFAANTEQAEGTAVNIKISSGTQPEPQPSQSSDISFWVDYSPADDTVFWLTVTVSDEDGARNVITREQRLKEYGGESVTVTGKGLGSITVIINNDVTAKYNVDFNTGLFV